MKSFIISAESLDPDSSSGLRNCLYSEYGSLYCITTNAQGTARSGNPEHPAFPAAVQPAQEYYGSCDQDKSQTRDIDR